MLRLLQMAIPGVLISKFSGGGPPNPPRKHSPCTFGASARICMTKHNVLASPLYANLVDEGEYNVANQPEQDQECPTTENSQVDNSETALSPCESIQPVTTPKQPTTSDHSKSQKPLKYRNEQARY